MQNIKDFLYQSLYMVVAFFFSPVELDGNTLSVLSVGMQRRQPPDLDYKHLSLLLFII